MSFDEWYKTFDYATPYFPALQKAFEAGAAAHDKALHLLLELRGQVFQARDGFGIWPYENSPSMRETLDEIEEFVAGSAGRESADGELT